jgi:hypothetical protein
VTALLSSFMGGGGGGLSNSSSATSSATTTAHQGTQVYAPLVFGDSGTAMAALNDPFAAAGTQTAALGLTSNTWLYIVLAVSAVVVIGGILYVSSR